jgi:hypothetical protein
MNDIEILWLSLLGLINYIIIGNIVFEIFQIQHFTILSKLDRRANCNILTETFIKCVDFKNDTHFWDKVFSYTWPVTILVVVTSRIVKVFFESLIIKGK